MTPNVFHTSVNEVADIAIQNLQRHFSDVFEHLVTLHNATAQYNEVRGHRERDDHTQMCDVECRCFPNRVIIGHYRCRK